MRQPLILHPDSTCPAVTGIEVDIVHGSGLLELHFVVTGAIEQLSLPPPSIPQRADALWKHSCFEAFVGASPGYFELNFSPSTQWAAYRFEDYRRGMRDAGIDPPRIATSTGPGRFELRAQVALPVKGLLGLSAVIEEKGGGKSYWALAHPPGAPDFHHQDCFALELPAATHI